MPGALDDFLDSLGNLMGRKTLKQASGEKTAPPTPPSAPSGIDIGAMAQKQADAARSTKNAPPVKSTTKKKSQAANAYNWEDNE